MSSYEGGCGFEVIKELEGIFDEYGNPIEFELVDTAEINLNDTAYSNMPNRSPSRAHTDFTLDWNWKDECLKFPVNLYKGNSGTDKIAVQGAAYVGFRKFDFDIDISDHHLNYVNLDAIPYVKIGVQNNVTAKHGLEFEERLFQFRFRIVIPTPAGIPIIIPVTLYVYGTCGLSGELSATLGLQYEYNCHCVATFRNGQWSSKATHGGFQNKSPWIVHEFDVDGKIYSGLKMGLLAGLYSATSGIGFNVVPNLSIGAKAKLASLDLLKINPKVYLDLNVTGDIYCVARLFGKNLAKYSLQLPEYTLWKEEMYLLPKIEKFTAVGSNTTADISWAHDVLYFLLPTKTGTAVFESDKTTEIKSYRPSPSSTTYDKHYYNVEASGLRPGRTYYAAPFAYLGGFIWYGDQTEFKTEGNYHLDFRCATQSYDVISFDFSLNNTSGNVIDYTTEATDYDGSPMRAHITATYDASSHTLNGVFDFYFYDDPGQQRKDGFSVSLATDDSGYVDCTKIIDNGGCYAALRIYNNSNSYAAKKRYAAPLIEDDCNIGIYNKYYRK